MSKKFEREPLDYLQTIVKGLREAPRKSVDGGVLVAEILDDTCQAWAEFLSEIVESAQQGRAPDAAIASANPK